MDYFVDSRGVVQPGPPPRPLHCINLYNLEMTLQALRLGGTFLFESEQHGRKFMLFRFRRDDGSRVALRVLTQFSFLTDPEYIQNLVRREVYVLKKLESAQFQYAPRCIAFDFSFNNPIRHPFEVLTWVPGQQLIWTKDHPAADLRMRVLNQLFQIQVELIDNSLESRPETAKQFYSRRIHDEMMSAPRGPPGAGERPTQEDYWSQLTRLEMVLGSSQDEKNYAVAHNNVVAENIIVDKDYNIECIVGWSDGGVYPIGQAATLPRLLTSNTGCGSPFEAHTINDKIQYRHPLNVYNLSLTPAKQAMLEWQNGTDADFRAVYMLSMKHSLVLSWLARHGWRPPYAHNYDNPPLPPMHLPHGPPYLGEFEAMGYAPTERVLEDDVPAEYSSPEDAPTECAPEDEAGSA